MGPYMQPDPIVTLNDDKKACLGPGEYPSGASHPFADFLSWLFLVNTADTNTDTMNADENKFLNTYCSRFHAWIGGCSKGIRYW